MSSSQERNKSPHSVSRRSFLRNSALLGMGGMLAGALNQPLSAAHRKPSLKTAGRFTYNAQGRFKIVQFTDTHYIAGDIRAQRALRTVEEILDAERPDFVIHTGDAIFGKPAEKSLRTILQPIMDRGIPFAVTLGNHDEEFGLTRREIYDILCDCPGHISSYEYKHSERPNAVVTLSKRGEKTPRWAFYLFDSGRSSPLGDIGGYDFIRFDQIQWYRAQSMALSRQHGGTPVDALAFFHIPLPEYAYALQNRKGTLMQGHQDEAPCPPDVNTGLFASMKEMGDVKAIITGHDHDNDFALRWQHMFLMYGRYSGGDTVYNNLKPSGARVIEFAQDEPGFHSWIRVQGGQVMQKMHYPNDF